MICSSMASIKACQLKPFLQHLFGYQDSNHGWMSLKLIVIGAAATAVFGTTGKMSCWLELQFF